MPNVTFLGRYYYANGFICRYSNRQLAGMIALVALGGVAGYLLLGMAGTYHFPRAIASLIHW